MQINEMIEAVQRKLKIQVDGKAGSETWGAIYAEIVKPTIHGVEPGLAILNNKWGQTPFIAEDTGSRVVCVG
ncbi:MAG: hypothetical protein ING69_18120 [Rhodocyclaceae bacterium]|nr:hypothetical protein [Rhodocyclaceae bacterium]MCA3084561.1 hypothetical protein [Rhodocyclaceae bacterium]MCA3085988.1 hypothetical protein [Rhodocyclaceae bacterium]